MSRVLVTGGSGFIARHALPALAAAGHEVHAVALRRTLPISNVVWHTVNLLDPNQAVQLLATVKPTHLLHFAWYAEHGEFWRSPLNLDWVATSVSLFKSFVEIGGQRAVFAGTCGEYDWSEPAPLVEDQTPSNPQTLYGVCKNATRQVIQSYADVADVSVAWGRIFFLYGADEHPKRLVPSILNPLRNNEIAYVRCGNHVRDLLHVQDVASAFVRLLESDVRGTVNIASGQGVTLGDVARQAAAVFGRPDLLKIDGQPPTPENPGIIVADNSRLLNEVGWSPKYDLASGLEQVAGIDRSHTELRQPAPHSRLHAGSQSGFRSEASVR